MSSPTAIKAIPRNTAKNITGKRFPSANAVNTFLGTIDVKKSLKLMLEATSLIASVEMLPAFIFAPIPVTFPKIRLSVITNVVIEKKCKNVLNARFPNFLVFFIVTIDKTTSGNTSGTITIWTKLVNSTPSIFNSFANDGNNCPTKIPNNAPINICANKFNFLNPNNFFILSFSLQQLAFTKLFY